MSEHSINEAEMLWCL